MGRINREGRGVIIGKTFVALFDVLEYLDQLKRNPVKGVGHSDPLRTPPPLRLSQMPKFVVFFFLRGPLSPSEIDPESLAAPIIGAVLRYRGKWQKCSDLAPIFAFLIKY